MVFQFFGAKKYFIFFQKEETIMSLQIGRSGDGGGGECMGDGILNFSQ
jgi:hypothetical protein